MFETEFPTPRELETIFPKVDLEKDLGQLRWDKDEELKFRCDTATHAFLAVAFIEEPRGGAPRPSLHLTAYNPYNPKQLGSTMYCASSTREWPVLDAVFGGREVWQAWMDRQQAYLDAYDANLDENFDPIRPIEEIEAEFA